MENITGKALTDITNIVIGTLYSIVNTKFVLHTLDESNNAAIRAIICKDNPDANSLFNDEKKYIRTIINLIDRELKNKINVRVEDSTDTAATIFSVLCGLSQTFENENFKQTFDQAVCVLLDEHTPRNPTLPNGTSYYKVVDCVKEFGASELIIMNADAISLKLTGKSYKVCLKEIKNMPDVETDGDPTDDPK
jgi:hypothetical protein